MTRDLFQRGDRLGEYEVLGRLKSGGMATLYLGRRHGAAGVSRLCAIKVIHPHLAEDEFIVKMFIDEARISSHIRHSNVVYIEKFGQLDGLYYIVLEYVEGCSLESLMRAVGAGQVKLEPAVAVHIAVEVAEGLHAAHETTDDAGHPLHIVHRDVSHSNVLIARDGRIKVIDFGIAKARGRHAQTRSGHNVKGKVRYMSPEQAWGKEVDARTDVYALGVVLWEMLTKHVLFQADDDLKTLDLVRNPQVVPPSTYDPNIHSVLDSVILRAIAKEPEKRYQTADAFRKDLIRAVPQATTVLRDQLAKLVSEVRKSIPPSTIELEVRKPSTPPRGVVGAKVDSSSVGSTQLTPNPPSGNGEVHARTLRLGRRLYAGAFAVVIAGVAGLAIALHGSSKEQPAVPPPPRNTALITPPPPPPPIDASVMTPPPPPPIDAAVDAPVDANTATPVIKHRPVRPKQDAAPSADDLLLGDPPPGSNQHSK
jgi:serine/threonine-protein kinase